MIRQQLVRDLSSDEKKWLALAIATLIISDEHVTEDEMQHLKDAWTFLETKQEIERLVHYVRQRKVPPLKPLIIDRKHAVMIFLYLIRTVVSDGQLREGEFKELEEMALRLGIFGDLKEELLTWALDFSKLNKRLIDFLK